jgi:extracellular factor (EF) 3-hydroxypalmitic acid methyl ester biosynthesis protein
MSAATARPCELRIVDAGAWKAQNASKSEPNRMLKTDSEIKDSLVMFQTGQGVEVRAGLVHLTRYQAVFEIYNPDLALCTSEVLGSFRILLNDRTVYSGRAVVGSLVNTGLMQVCQVALDEHSWPDVELKPGATGKEKLRRDFSEFIHEWQKLYLVSRDYKVVIADIESFLAGLRLWLDQVELTIRASPAANRAELEQEIAEGLRDSVVPPANSLFDRFEEVSDRIEEELRPAHRSFGRRQLHPLLLCAPFIHRCYTKPLGFAGDYEMINMIIRNRCEGGSLFAKLINMYLLNLGPPQAVRNRVGFLKERIISETCRLSRQGRMASIYSLACGPAREVEEFLAEHPLADQAQFRLLDFNEETLRYTANRLEEVRRQYHRRSTFTLVKNSVQQLLKDSHGPGSLETGYDLIYCSGLYDYLSDRICQALNTYLYERLRPGGLLVVGNFAPNTPRQNLMEDLCEWFLIYRDSRKLVSLAPRQASLDDCVIRAEPMGANIFLEVRKPQ